MAYWLADKRRGQHASHIQRFDPRFWTVDFPRPAMASIVTTGPDSVRVDCEFHHDGELVGLIWDSTDSWDHPLLAYETNRDYSHTVLSFRWQSDDLIPLDQPNGPTLTIEGRDAAGNARNWYVRLWNYAEGTPTDATVTLPFSDLESGYTLPGEPVYPADIDRMFLSLVPINYVPGGSSPLPSRANGHALISQINCFGRHAMLETGYVLVPEHGERIATAYDDAYNQTPARIIRSVFGLGYREEVVHYVGMSHFMRLARGSGDILTAQQPAQMCEPAEQWHRSFLTEAMNSDLDVIASISYELFAAYCPEAWKQRAHDGEAAETGWVPPSALLSPANADAMAWVQQAALAFTQVQKDVGQPVRLQIGEPWWWVIADGRPCLYDDAAVSAFGGAPPIITDLRAPLDADQVDLLDEAGAILAQSTADLAQVVREDASGAAEILLLAFTPTILDPQTPESHRANLPAGWAWPAFDRLQLEDYDWLTAGASAARRQAYEFVDQKLAYPVSAQDYLSGFVLNAADAEAMWAFIDQGLDEAKERGVSRRFVWALPQISRDGYTRLPSKQENDVQPFDDVLYPLALGRTTAAGPEFSTSVAVTASGHEKRNSLWADARMHFDVGPGIRSESELSQLLAFFRARRGAARGFRINDPFDFSSNAMTASPTKDDQLIGIGDGLNADFRLVKTYGDQADPQERFITRPRIETVLISVDGVLTNDWTLGEKGSVSLGTAPALGAEVRAGFLFDVPVRFAEDRIDIAGINFAAGEVPSVALIEIKEAAQ